uniref:GST N-terminal domain-containing protein n=1 Tax=Tetraselmis chuii TaxID=63592 RepID=A0A7S1T0D5_9CHLO|mmetsp:Transcript_38974/g.69840  ORF Transcript_38974/g.69840 Transcript_38974/m.69840 type:complete len:456 (+) Transcript_38974:231-1598(+)
MAAFSLRSAGALPGSRPSPIRRAQRGRRSVVLNPLERAHVATMAAAADNVGLLPAIDWDLLERSSPQLDGYTLRAGQVPSSCPTEDQLPTSSDSDTAKRVLLYRDTNAWCPFCERVWFALLEKGIEFDTVFIDLRAKPDWYLEMVPTGMVPAAKVDGKLIYESADILKALEESFPDTPLLPPSDDPMSQRAAELIDMCDNSGVGGAGYTYLAGRRMGGDASDPPPSVEELKAAFEAKLNEMEEVLGESEGPFFLPEFSLVDIMFTPAMERLACNMPRFRGFSLRDNPSYPRVGAWLAALEARPAFSAIKSDPETLGLIFGKVFGLSPAQEEEERDVGALEAGGKLKQNHAAVVADVLKNAGISQDSGAEFVASAVEMTVYNLAATLLGQPLKTVESDKTEYNSPADALAMKRRVAAVSAATLAFLRNRVSSPRDMTASAAVAFREAAVKQLVALY